MFRRVVFPPPEEPKIETICDKVLILNKGKIEQFAEPSEIIKNPKSQFVNDFILKQLEVKKNNIYKLFNL